MKRNLLLQLALAVVLASAAKADIYTVTLNTSPLAGNGPFMLDLQFLDGSGLPGDLNNNVVTLTNFTFGAGGGALGSGTSSGGATGSLTAGVTLKDAAFLNEYTENFTPGALLSFTLNTTNNLDPGGTPDLFTLAILDSFGSELPTTGPADEFLNVALTGRRERTGDSLWLGFWQHILAGCTRGDQSEPVAGAGAFDAFAALGRRVRLVCLAFRAEAQPLIRARPAHEDKMTKIGSLCHERFLRFVLCAGAGGS